ncbi:hypothetical protein [Asticcacaulis sp.]|uniref:hypothetical protein n=1 Tax=Asticcacaulis sp. TaxID=1872648 RepID=UPI00260BDDBF|nr:hypothetical protein [Asticcacaulis sp.]
MSALFDIIIGFIAALVSAAFLHFGAGAAPEQPKPAPVTQKQAVPATAPVTPVSETTPLSQPAPAQEAAPPIVAVKSETVKSEPKRDAAAVTAPVVRVQTVRSETQTALPPVVAPAPPAPPALALPPLPAVPALRLHVAALSAEDQANIAREVEKSLRAAEQSRAYEISIAVRGEDAKWVIRAAKAAKASRQAQEDALSGPCPDSHGAPATGQIRTIVAQ